MTEFKEKPVNGITKFLWNAAGADEDMLKKCSYKERVTYYCLGGIVASTGILAAITGGYAFTFVFSSESIGGKLAAVIFGLFWGYIIYNLDRFIVAAGGKGDGTEKMTWKEFTRALPRLGMAFVIGMTLSAPLELKIFEKEINAEIVKRKGEAVKDYNENILSANYDDKIAVLDSTILSYKKEIKIGLVGIDQQIADKEDLIANQQNQYNEEARDKRPGPRAAALLIQLDKLEKQLVELNVKKGDIKAELQEEFSPLIAQVQKKIDKLESNKTLDIAEFKQTLSSFDGIAARLEAAHNSKDISEAYLWFIRLLLLVIELTPIMFKMQLTKGAYDYMEENKKYLVMASQGVQIDYKFHKDNESYDHVTFHQVDVKKHALTREAELQKGSIDKEAEKLSNSNNS